VSKLLEYLPGLSAAVLAYGVLKIVGLLGIGSGVLEFVLFIAVYLGFAVIVEQGMRGYNRNRR